MFGRSLQKVYIYHAYSNNIRYNIDLQIGRKVDPHQKYQNNILETVSIDLGIMINHYRLYLLLQNISESDADQSKIESSRVTQPVLALPARSQKH